MKVTWKVISISKMNLKISVVTEQYHIVQKSTHSWFLASTEAVWGVANAFGINIISNYQGNAHTKFFWLNFVFFETYEQVCILWLNSLPCILRYHTAGHRFSQVIYHKYSNPRISIPRKSRTNTVEPRGKQNIFQISDFMALGWSFKHD